jgi:Flp pilus assembly pilin Flp
MGQTTVEYAVVFVCIVAALIAMKPYITRAIQGRLRSAADQIGEQYEPKKMSGTVTTTVDRKVTTNITMRRKDIVENGETIPRQATLREETYDTDTTTRTGTETVGAF